MFKWLEMNVLQLFTNHMENKSSFLEGDFSKCVSLQPVLGRLLLKVNGLQTRSPELGVSHTCESHERVSSLTQVLCYCGENQARGVEPLFGSKQETSRATWNLYALLQFPHLNELKNSITENSFFKFILNINGDIATCNLTNPLHVWHFVAVIIMHSKVTQGLKWMRWF